MVAKLEYNAAEQTDDELVAAVCAGDEAAFAQLFERYRRMVTGLGYRFFYRREQVEDIVQESFAEAYFSLAGYRGGQERSFAAWLSQITVRTCYHALKRSRPSESSISELTENDEAIIAEKLRVKRAAADIEYATISRDLADKLLQRLQPEDRIVLGLLDIAEMSVAEAAELTGWSQSKVKMRAHRARTALRRVLHRFL